MASEYFIRRGDRVDGPISASDLRKLSAQGKISALSKVSTGSADVGTRKSTGVTNPNPSRASSHQGSPTARPVLSAAGLADHPNPTVAIPPAVPTGTATSHTRTVLLVAGIAGMVALILIAGAGAVFWGLQRVGNQKSTTASTSHLGGKSSESQPGNDPPSNDPVQNVAPQSGQRPDPELRGPVVKRLQLGMDFEAARTLVVELVGGDVTMSKEEKVNGVVALAQAMRGRIAPDPAETRFVFKTGGADGQTAVTLGKNAQGRLSLFRFEGSFLDRVFHSEGLTETDFVKACQKHYKVGSCTTELLVDGLGLAVKGYVYRDPLGWEFKALGYAKFGIVVVEFQLVQPVSDAKFD